MKFTAAGSTKRRASATSAILVAVAFHVFPSPIFAQEPESAPTAAQVNARAATPAAGPQAEPAEGGPRFGGGPARGRSFGSGRASSGMSPRLGPATLGLGAEVAPARFEATVYEVQVPENRVADLDAESLEAKATSAQSLAKALAEIGQTKVLYKVDQRVNLFSESITLGTSEPMVTGTHVSGSGQSINSVTYQQTGLIINISASRPPPEAKRQGLETQITFHLSVLAPSGVELAPNVKANSIRNVELSHSENPRFGKPCVLLTLSGATTSGATTMPTAYVISYVARTEAENSLEAGRGRSVSREQRATPRRSAAQLIEVSVPGLIQPNAKLELRARTSGVVERVGFQEGASVRKGQLLVQLSSPGLTAELAAAEAEFKRADLEDRRLRTVAEQTPALVAAGSLEQAQAAMETSRANLDLRKDQLKQTRVVAPWDGVIGTSKIQPGEGVTPNTPLGSLYDLSAFKVEFPVAAEYIGQLRMGEKVKVRVEPGSPDLIEGEISFIAPAIDEATRTFRVKAKLADSNQRLWPGMYATVILDLPAKGVSDRFTEPSPTGQASTTN